MRSDDKNQEGGQRSNLFLLCSGVVFTISSSSAIALSYRLLIMLPGALVEIGKEGRGGEVSPETSGGRCRQFCEEISNYQHRNCGRHSVNLSINHSA
jgi:hypothetical protein